MLAAQGILAMLISRRCSHPLAHIMQNGVGAVPGVLSFVYRHSFLCEGQKRADSLLRDTKTEFCLLFLLLSNKSHLRTLDHMGPVTGRKQGLPL